MYMSRKRALASSKFLEDVVGVSMTNNYRQKDKVRVCVFIYSVQQFHSDESIL